jgi:OmpA-OmpF porin, OOP family
LAPLGKARHNERVRGLAITYLVVSCVGFVGGCGAKPAHDDVKSAKHAPMRSEYVPAKIDTGPCLTCDADLDGFTADVDQCPGEAEDKDGFQDDDGCPEGDDDKDGIVDEVDKCPREPETYNGFQDEDGCPDKYKVYIEPPAPVVEHVRFVGGGAVIAPQSMAMLNEVAKVMKDHPEIQLVQVEAHTDENGPAAANVKLSQARAQAVVDALVKLGVESARLTAQGFGGYCPLDPAHTAQAWEKNRRAEFRVMKKDGAPTGAATGCPEATAHGVVSKPVP